MKQKSLGVKARKRDWVSGLSLLYGAFVADDDLSVRVVGVVVL